MAPTRGVVKAVNVAAQAFLRTVSKVVGGDVVDDAIAFFQAFDGMEAGLPRAGRARARAARPPARRRSCSWRRRGGDTVEEAVVLRRPSWPRPASRSRRSIVNRMHPRFGDGRAEATRERARTLAGTDLGGLYANLADFQLVAAREEEHLAGLAGTGRAGAGACGCRSSQTDVHDLDGLDEIGAHLFR